MRTDALRVRWPLDWWDSEEWSNVQRKLDRMEEDCIPYNPNRADLFRALDITWFDRTNVVIVGQDPYPNPKYATGVAFSSHRGLWVGDIVIPSPDQDTFPIPASLRTLYRELVRRQGDMSLPFPTHGCLEGWCSQGVLLWNATPTIEIRRDDNGWKGYTHKYWPEWPPLTQEILERLSAKGHVVFAFLGAEARAYSKFVDPTPGYNSCLFYTHPSPMAQRWTDRPLVGSGLFTTINCELTTVHRKEPVDWRIT